jgi:hypothetical protein
MSALSLQGKLFLKTKDFPELKEVFELFSSLDLIEFDKKFREMIERKFPTKNERENFFNEDFNFHFNLIRKDEDKKVKEFFQFLFLPFDWFRFSSEVNKNPSKSEIGYFKKEELKEILNKKFPEEMTLPIRKIFEKFKKEKEEKLTKEVFETQEKFFEKLKLKSIKLYFKIEKAKENETEKIAKKAFSKLLPLGNFYPFELFKFYLPYFFKKEIFYFTDTFEFLFFYFKQRFIFWKILVPEKV